MSNNAKVVQNHETGRIRLELTEDEALTVLAGLGMVGFPGRPWRRLAVSLKDRLFAELLP